MKRLLVALILISAGAPAAAQDCAPLVDSLQQIGAALDEVRLDDAAALSQQALADLSCQQALVSNLGLISLYQLAGAVEIFRGDTAAAELHFGRAVAVSPTARLDASLGADAEAVYERVRAQALSIQGGVVEVDPVVQAWVDGRKLEPDRPLDLAAGQHLVQVERGGELAGAIFRLGPGETRSINAEGQAVLSSGGSRPPAETGSVGTVGSISAEPERDGPRWVLIGGGGAGVVVGGVVLALAGASHKDFAETEDYDALASLQSKTNALAITGIALGTVGVGLVGVGFIDHTPTLGTTLRW